MTFASDVAATSPSGWWRLGEASGNAADSSGNGKTATPGGTITRPVTGLVPGDSNTAYNFTGAGQIDTPTFSGAADGASLSAFIAFKLNAVGTEQALIGMANEANGQRRYSLRVSSANKLIGWVSISGSGTISQVTGTTTLTAGVTHTAALTYNGASLRLFLDGVLEASLPLSGAVAAFGGSLGGLIGSAYNGSLYARANAVLDEAIYWGGTALSDATVATLSNGIVPSAVTVAGESWIGSAVALDGTPQVGLRVNGDPAVAAATMLDGTPQVGLRVAGEPAVAVATMLEGTIPVSVPVLVTGESWAAAATALDGTGRLVVTGDVWATSADFLNGNVVGAPIILTGESWAASTVVLDGIAFTPPPLSGLGIGLDSEAVLTVDEPLEPEPTVPAGTPPTVLHIITPTAPVPTLVAGRPQ